jgi:NTP pyrophosphatase (non-canonical NTP hydrolase)
MGSDSETTIGELRKAIGAFVAERSWERFHAPKNLAMSIAIEAAELMELFQWQDADDGPKGPGPRESDAQLADELADVLIYCLALANREDIDLSAAVLAKLGENAERYPVGSEPP